MLLPFHATVKMVIHVDILKAICDSLKSEYKCKFSRYYSLLGSSLIVENQKNMIFPNKPCRGRSMLHFSFKNNEQRDLTNLE